MNIIINPGTEKQSNHTKENAIKVAEFICKDLDISKDHFESCKTKVSTDGWYGFIFKGAGGKIRVDIPGIDPKIVRLGEPWKSPRLYVDESSWLYGYALGFIREGIEKKII